MILEMYDKISQDWARKRRYPWKPFIELLSPWLIKWNKEYMDKENDNSITFQKVPIFIDLGAGTGRHSDYFLSYCHNLIDLDVSRGMLKANTSSSQKIQTDLNALPFRRNIADGIFSVAAIHHIMSKSNRELLLREISKIGKKDGLIVFTVWRFYQNKFKLEYKQQIHNLQKISKNFELGDVMVPWKLSQNGQNLMISRFYHLFRISEFNEFIKNAHFLLPYYFGTFKTKNLKKNFIFIGKNRK